MATRKISFLLPGIRGFSLAVRLLLPALINAEGIPLIGNMMFPAGASGPSNSLPSSGPRWDIDLNKIPPLGEEEIQGAIDLNKTPRQLDAEAQLLQKRQLEIDEKRASIRAWVDWRIRTEIETQGGPPLVGPIEDLDEQVSTVITFGPQRDPSNLTKVGRCLSIPNKIMVGKRLFDKNTGGKGHRRGSSRLLSRGKGKGRPGTRAQSKLGWGIEP